MRRPGIPPALGWLLVAVALAGVSWALLVPPFQVPDEDAHFAYAQTVAELHRAPRDDGRPLLVGGKSTEQDLAERASGFLSSYQRIEAKPAWSGAAEERYDRAEAALGPEDRRDGGGANAAQNNLPTYYVYAALAYEVAGGTVLDRLYAIRLWSVPLLLLFALSAWLLAGELTGRDRPAQVCAGALAGLLPMATFVSAAVTPDAMLLPVWGLATWVGVRGLRRGFTAASAVALLGLTALAVAIKPVGVALVPGVLWALWRGRGLPVPPWRIAVPALLVLGAAAAVAITPGGPPRLASYLWQFYLPELPGQERFALLPQWPLRDVWFEGVTGAFGWLEVRFPAWVYVLLLAAAAMLAVGAARHVRVGADTAVFIALPALALLAGLHLTEYRFLVLDDRAFTQGRYLLPLAPLAAALAAAGLGSRRVPLVLGALVAWQLASLAIVTSRFYA